MLHKPLTENVHKQNGGAGKLNTTLCHIVCILSHTFSSHDNMIGSMKEITKKECDRLIGKRGFFGAFKYTIMHLSYVGGLHFHQKYRIKDTFLTICPEGIQMHLTTGIAGMKNLYSAIKFDELKEIYSFDVRQTKELSWDNNEFLDSGLSMLLNPSVSGTSSLIGSLIPSKKNTSNLPDKLVSFHCVTDGQPWGIVFGGEKVLGDTIDSALQKQLSHVPFFKTAHYNEYFQRSWGNCTLGVHSVDQATIELLFATVGELSDMSSTAGDLDFGKRNEMAFCLLNAIIEISIMFVGLDEPKEKEAYRKFVVDMGELLQELKKKY